MSTSKYIRFVDIASQRIKESRQLILGRGRQKDLSLGGYTETPTL